MKALMTVLCVFLGSSFVHTSTAHAFCTEDPDSPNQMENWADQPEIPVYVDKGLIERLIRTGGVPWTFSQVVREVHWATNLISTNSGTNLPHFYYAGLSSDCGGWGSTDWFSRCPIPNAVNITYGIQPAPAAATRGVPASVGMVVAFNEALSWDTGTEGGGLFQGALVHELLHTLGFSHPADCDLSCLPGEEPCSAVSGNYDITNELQQLYLTDVLGFRSVYGPWQRTAEDHHEDSNHLVGGSWWDIPYGIPDLMPHFEASGAPGVDDMLVAGRDPMSLEPIFYHWDWPSFAWTRWGASFPGESHVGRVGAAWNHDKEWGVIGYQSGETTVSVTKTLNRLLLTSPSTFGSAATPSMTRRPGVSATYQNIDGLSLFATRSNTGQIEIHWIDSDGVYTGPFPVWDDTGAEVRAYDTPSIACGDEFGIYYNCMIAWAADDLTHTLRWMHFGLHPDATGALQVERDMIRADSIMLDSAPHVTFRGPAGAPSAWILAFTAKIGVQHYVYTMHKSIEWTSLWDPQSWVLHGPYDTQVSATVGSANLDGELLVTD
ncbi:MAG: hypothetical protein DRJ42_09740 [Deltaproteobacteria bacterium]|nr:MAG: hypothetical protein DRJ42_09740 [Deltaproteobacteria bacterium]